MRIRFYKGKSLRFKYQHGECDDSQASSQLAVGLFFFTMYWTFHLPERFYFHRKCIATWDNNKEFMLVVGRDYGFYFYDWAFVWSFHAKINGSSARDPWWMRQYIHLDELVFGKTEIQREKIIDIENVVFSLDGKEFVMDLIEWIRYTRFRRFIPWSIYHTKQISVDMKIESPPMYSGKSENSWDCGDDGTFGSHQPWHYEKPSYLNRDKMAQLAVDLYVGGVLKDVAKRGGSTSNRGISRGAEYVYLGRKLIPDPAKLPSLKKDETR